MKHAYLIIAHKVDKTLTALLQMLDDPRNDIYLHMDAKNVAFKDTDLPSLGNASLHQIHRISVSWGGYSLVRCEMMLFEAACSNGPYAYYHLISGQDLPIKTQDQIHSFFSRNAGKEFVRFQSEEFCFQDRVRYFHFFHERCGRGDRKSFWTFAESVSLALQRVLGVRRNPDIRFQKGTQWVSVTDDFVRKLVENRKWVESLFRNTSCADEVYKQTFAINFGFENRLYHPQFDNDPVAMVRLIDWTRGNPYVWTIADKEEILSSQMMFARKFDENVDSEIIEYLKDSMRGNRQPMISK